MDWGKGQPQEIQTRLKKAAGNGKDYVGRNPILFSVLLHHPECTELLHQFGYRIPQKVVEAGREGEQEVLRQKSISRAATNSHVCSLNLIKMAMSFFQNLFAVSAKENQVQTVLDFKGYTDPNYLSIAFTKKVASLMENERWTSLVEQKEGIKFEEEGGLELERVTSENFLDFDSELEDLQKLDPLRKAFDLAATAEDFTNNFQGIVELKKNYGDIKRDLDQFSHNLLSQCYNEEEAGIIMRHNPDDDDDDDLDPEEQNWQRALWERRKSFVGHPFYQESIWEQLLGNGRQAACYRKDRAWFNIIFVPYTLLLFSFLPLVVLLDILFRDADILFITPAALEKRGSHDNPFFGFFRSQIHIKMLRMIMYHWSQVFYLITLFLVVQNPNKTEENRMSHWYNYMAVGFSFGLLWNEVLTVWLRKKGVSKWVIQNIVTQILFLAGWGTTFAYQCFHSNRNVDRADISGNSLLSIAETFLAAGVFMAYFRF